MLNWFGALLRGLVAFLLGALVFLGLTAAVLAVLGRLPHPRGDTVFSDLWDGRGVADGSTGHVAAGLVIGGAVCAGLMTLSARRSRT